MLQERLRDILSQWNHLLDVVSLRKHRLDAAVRYHQLFADADDIDNWMLDTLRFVTINFLYYFLVFVPNFMAVSMKR